MFGFVSKEEHQRLVARVEMLERQMAVLYAVPKEAEPEKEQKARKEKEIAVQWDNLWAYDGRPQREA